jgi:hypothetical protein
LRRRTANGERRKWILFCVLQFAFCVSLFGFNNLSVERRAIRSGETLLIVVSLEDDFAELDHVDLPLRNLVIDNPPSVARDFAWINGVTVHRKILRYRARPMHPGPALVGPLVLRAGQQTDTLPAIAIEVIPDRAATSNDPQVILSELLATGREPLFIVAETDRQSAYAGEQIIVTWYLYNGSTVNQWQIGAIPKLDGFWVEELDVRSARPATVFVGETAVQKMAVRRVALYPLRSGRLEVGPMEIEAAVMRRTSRGPFSMFEGNVVELGFASAPLHIDALPLPPGPPVAAVGDLSLRCLPPRQENGGPVIVDATVTGPGNLRAAQPPQFARPPAGDVQRIERGVTVQRSGESAVMTRRWQFQIFPRQAGTLHVPSLQLPVFSTTARARQTLQCTAAELTATLASRPLAAPAGQVSAPAIARGRVMWPYAVALAIAVIFLLVVLPRWIRRSALDRTIRRMIGDGDPSAVRDNVHASLEQRGIDPASLLRESTDRGDAYRALRSLLDALERDRIEVSDRRREMRRRIRELLLA